MGWVEQVCRQAPRDRKHLKFIDFKQIVYFGIFQLAEDRMGGAGSTNLTGIGGFEGPKSPPIDVY
jgi:hypothetical protein